MNERLRILNLLEQGKINSDEAARLLEALAQPWPVFQIHMQRLGMSPESDPELHHWTIILNLKEWKTEWQNNARRTLLAIALERYRLDNGEYPVKLDALQPVYLDYVPLDPFTEHHFLYERTADSYRIRDLH